jgi:hypothetical protein
MLCGCDRLTKKRPVDESVATVGATLGNVWETPWAFFRRPDY